MFQREYDFSFDGLQIIRKKDISNIIQSDANAYCMKLMRREGLWKTHLPKWIKDINLTSWETAFHGIRSKVVIVENENVKSGFFIGPIVNIGRAKVTIHWFDGMGELGSRESVKYSDITSCRFMDRYSTIHGKYIKSARQIDSSEAVAND